MHISDAHISLSNDDPEYTSRMYSAFAHPTDKVTREPTTTSTEFVRALELACREKVDLIALGGDIVNFPSKETVSWVLGRLQDEGCGIPFVYTAGNHDWHLEGLPGDATYDAQRVPQLSTTLQPLLQASAAGGLLYGGLEMKGVEVLVVDNSNHQVNEEQLDFARKRLDQQGGPVVMLMHMPLALPGLSLHPKECCGHPNWGAFSDDNYKLEGRPRWPAGNLPSTQAFLELVREHAAPAGRIVAMLTGHVHRDFSVELADKDSAANKTTLVCNSRLAGCGLRAAGQASVMQIGSAVGGEVKLMEADGAVQYTTLDAAEGGFRLLTVHVSTTV